MNREYAGFFDIGMVQRNEVNAIVSHGTMCLVRREALVDAGGWSSDTIVEDADLGLTLLARGWRTHYTRRRYGWGLLPSDFAAYKRQRHRWAYGGVQLIKKHWRAFMPGGAGSRRSSGAEFLFGWLTWLGAESLGVAIAILNLIWMPLVAFLGIAVPEAVLTIPVLADLRGHASAFHGALPDAGAGADLRLARRRLLGHGPATHGRPRRGGWAVQGRRAVPAHGQRRCIALDASASRLYGKGVLGTLLMLGSLGALSHQRPAGDRDLDLQRGAAGAEPALPRRRGGDAVRALLAQRLRHLAQARGALPPTVRACRAGPSRRLGRRRAAISVSFPS